jgi:hypothetical protein
MLLHFAASNIGPVDENFGHIIHNLADLPARWRRGQLFSAALLVQDMPSINMDILQYWCLKADIHMGLAVASPVAWNQPPRTLKNTLPQIAP